MDTIRIIAIQASRARRCGMLGGTGTNTTITRIMNRKSAHDFLNSLDPAISEAMSGMTPSFPDLVNPFIERLYGEVYQRDNLTLRERLLVTVAALAVSGKPEPQLAVQLRLALKNGVSRDDLMEIALQLSVFFGFAVGMNAIQLIDPIADEVEIAMAEPAVQPA